MLCKHTGQSINRNLSDNISTMFFFFNFILGKICLLIFPFPHEMAANPFAPPQMQTQQQPAAAEMLITDPGGRELLDTKVLKLLSSRLEQGMSNAELMQGFGRIGKLCFFVE